MELGSSSDEKIMAREAELRAALVEKGYPIKSIHHGYIHENGKEIGGTGFLGIYDHEEKLIEIYEIIDKGNGRRLSDSIFHKYSKLFKENHINAFYTFSNRKNSNNNEFKFERVGEHTSNIQSFINALDQIRDDNYIYFYRGHSDINYRILPTLFRNQKYAKNEMALFKEAIRLCAHNFTVDMSTFDKLVMMQHYGLTTRLFDVTTNPLVALYFAAESNPQKFGEVLLFKYKKEDIKMYDGDSVSIYSNMATVENFNFDKNKEKLCENASYLNYEVAKEKVGFEWDVEPINMQQILCVQPKLDNERIKRQQGAFLLFGIDKDKEHPAKLTEAPQRIIIENKYKNNLLRQLAELGITKSYLFPEIENILEEIVKKYR